MSLQRHQHRAEHWVVVAGTARVTCDDRVFDLPAGEATFLPLHSIHRPGELDRRAGRDNRGADGSHFGRRRYRAPGGRLRPQLGRPPLKSRTFGGIVRLGHPRYAAHMIDHAALTQRWASRLARPTGPLYLSIVEALTESIRSGDLQEGDRLPPHRQLAAELKVDLTHSDARLHGGAAARLGRGDGRARQLRSPECRRAAVAQRRTVCGRHDHEPTTDAPGPVTTAPAEGWSCEIAEAAGPVSLDVLSRHRGQLGGANCGGRVAGAGAWPAAMPATSSSHPARRARWSRS